MLDLEHAVLTLEPLLAPFTDKGKQVSSSVLEVIPELKTQTEGTRDQWGPDV